jgi:hypothetical protein
MKRRDMVDIIATIIVNDLNNNYVDPNSKRTQKFANKILTTLEKKGMVPPPDNSIGESSLGIPCQWEYDGENHE